MDDSMYFEGRRVWVKSNGYPCVTFLENGKKVNRHVHRIVAERMLGEPLGSRHVHHKDRNKLNWTPENLEVLSAKQHALLHAREAIFAGGGHPDTHAKCSACKLVLPRDRFYKATRTWNGLYNVCKECQAIRSAQWVAKHPDKVAEGRVKDWERVKANPELRAARLAYRRNWFAKPENRERTLAKQRVAYHAKKAKRAHEVN